MDDLVIANTDISEISRVKSELSAAFEMKDLRDLHYFLRIKVIHTPKGILLTQCQVCYSWDCMLGNRPLCMVTDKPTDENCTGWIRKESD